MPISKPGIAFDGANIVAPGISFIQSPGYARNYGPTNSVFAQIMAIQPLCGFGTYISWDFYGGGSGDGSTISNPAYKDNWPKVYAVETRSFSTPSLGHSGIWTTSFGADGDPSTGNSFSATTVTTGGPWAASLPIPSDMNYINTITVTPTTITIDYWEDAAHTNPGTFTLTLSGHLFDFTAPGPFNPSDSTYGWAALTARCNEIIANATMPPKPTNNASQPYAKLVPFDYPFSQQFFPLEPDTVIAAANGLGVRTDGSGNAPTPPFVMEFVGASVADYPSPYNEKGRYAINSGACISIASKWWLAGKAWTIDFGSIDCPTPSHAGQTQGQPINTNNHTTLYSQSYDPNAAAMGAPALASGFTNPLDIPNVIEFLPTDVNSPYGMLAFLPTAA